MTEDEAFNELAAQLKRQAQAKEEVFHSRAHIATAEFIASRTVDELAITTIRKAFEYGYRTGWREAKEDK